MTVESSAIFLRNIQTRINSWRSMMHVCCGNTFSNARLLAELLDCLATDCVRFCVCCRRKYKSIFGIYPGLLPNFFVSYRRIEIRQSFGTSNGTSFEPFPIWYAALNWIVNFFNYIWREPSIVICVFHSFRSNRLGSPPRRALYNVRRQSVASLSSVKSFRDHIMYGSENEFIVSRDFCRTFRMSPLSESLPGLRSLVCRSVVALHSAAPNITLQFNLRTAEILVNSVTSSYILWTRYFELRNSTVFLIKNPMESLRECFTSPSFCSSATLDSLHLRKGKFLRWNISSADFISLFSSLAFLRKLWRAFQVYACCPLQNVELLFSSLSFWVVLGITCGQLLVWFRQFDRQFRRHLVLI